MTCGDCQAIRSERDRLQKLFDDAGEGQYNVLNLIDYYQREASESKIAEAAEAVERVRDAVTDVWRRAVQPATEAVERAHRLEREHASMRETLAKRASAEDASAARLGVDVVRLREWVRRRERAQRADKVLVVDWLRALLAIIEGGAA